MRRLITAGLLLVFVTCATYSIASSKAKPESPIHPPFRELWEFVVGDISRFGGNIKDSVVSDGILYYVTGDSCGAINLDQDKILWKRDLPYSRIGSNIAFGDKTLFLTTHDTKLIACDPKTGKSLWSLPLKGWAGPVTVHNGVVYTEMRDGVLSAVDTKTKKQIWSIELKVRPEQRENKRNIGLAIPPVILNNSLLIGTYTSDLLCVNKSNGKIQWKYTFGKPDECIWVGGIVPSGKTVYARSGADELVALDAATGKLIWQVNLDSYLHSGGSPILSGDLIILPAQDGAIYAYRSSDGQQCWRNVLSPKLHLQYTPILQGGQIITASRSKLFAFDEDGKELWTWDTEDYLAYKPIIVENGKLIIEGQDRFFAYIMVPETTLPEDLTARREMAEKLVARLDKLGKDEKHTLIKLGDQAFESLLPVVRKRLLKTAGDYDYFQSKDALKLLTTVATKERTPEMLNLFKDARYSSTNILQWLIETGDEQQTIPFFLDIIKNATSNGSNKDKSSVRFVLEALIQSTDPRAVNYLLSQLNDPTADIEIRRAAFTNLARIGGKAEVEAVIAAKDNRREIPTITELLELDKFKLESKGKFVGSAKMISTEKDENGTVWGLFRSDAAGKTFDLWISRFDGITWTLPLFTGVSTDRDEKVDGWFSEFVGNAAISSDSDGDGWTDLFEKRIGSNPNDIDTDKDGLKDSEDKNPLTAPRELSEDEKVLAAAFQGRYQFEYDRKSVCLVTLPEGIEPFEFTGWDWIIVAKPKEGTSPLTDCEMQGIASVKFDCPHSDLNGFQLNPNIQKSAICWNEDHTEAKVQVCVRYGGLDGTGFDIRLRKFGSEWVIVEMVMAWIS